ncbi:unnamed protein product [Prorocentrum cordatum]|uniref:Uncharacterized protein n=1 Tax=Prorocentrum cordatum TaxID=2364126 RepID=A0ABN9W596_9DINO|nr:unnamed protein product [Polarella glacialis]
MLFQEMNDDVDAKSDGLTAAELHSQLSRPKVQSWFKAAEAAFQSFTCISLRPKWDAHPHVATINPLCSLWHNFIAGFDARRQMFDAASTHEWSEWLQEGSQNEHIIFQSLCRTVFQPLPRPWTWTRSRHGNSSRYSIRTGRAVSPSMSLLTGACG